MGKIERYTSVTKNGYLSVLENYYNQYGSVPIHIQKTILYEIMWHVKRLVNHSERVSFLSFDDKELYIQILFEIFKYIDKNVINDFDLAGCWFYHKMGLITYFKKEEPDFQIVYVERYDRIKELVQLRYFCNDITYEDIIVDGVKTVPVYVKTTKHDFLGADFIYERRIWVSIHNIQKLNIGISNIQTRISLAGKQSKSGLNVGDVIKYFNSKIPSYDKKDEFLDSWVFIDRDTQADDNAEHLYRYVRDNHPERKIFYILRAESYDWPRLNDDGFNLLSYGSESHINALKSCSKVISSHIDSYVVNYLGTNMLAGRHFVFLQHGVTKDNLSNWVNHKENIDCFITASPYEYESIVNEGSSYIYNKKEVVLTGFPRHDLLIKKNNPDKIVLVMPTWRKDIVGNAVSLGNERSYNSEFMQSKYAIHWYDFIHSEKLKYLTEHYRYKVVFFPHANIQPYIPLFEIPDYIEIVTHQDGSIQDLFGKASMMVTDYSSVAFEMAVQNKQTIYYQFDEDEFFSGGHAYTKGYFDYREHGFGDVCNTQDELLASLELALQNDSKPSDEIIRRIQKTFPFRDGSCCKRVYEAIKSLDEPLDFNYIDKDIVRSYAIQASKIYNWKDSVHWWKALLSESEFLEYEDDLIYIEALRESGSLTSANERLCDVISNSPDGINEAIFISRALLYMAKQKWDLAINDWHMISANNINWSSYLYCLYRSGNMNELFKIVQSKEVYSEFANLYYLSLKNHQEKIIEHLEVVDEAELIEATVELDSIDRDVLYHSQNMLVLSDLYTQLSLFEKALEYLNKAIFAQKSDIFIKYREIFLLNKNKKWSDVVLKFKELNLEVSSLPAEYVYYYIEALCSLKKKNEALLIFENISPTEYNDYERYFYARMCMIFNNWDMALSFVPTNFIINPEHVEVLSIILKNNGEFEKAFLNVKENADMLTSSGWLLRTELAQLNDDWFDAYQSWRHYLSMNPTKVTPEFINKLQHLKMLSQFALNNAS